MAVTEIGDFVNRTFRAPLRPAVDEAKYSNALLKSRVDAAPAELESLNLSNQGQRQQIEHNKQAFGDQQKANARAIMARGFAAIAQSANPSVAAQQFLADPNFKAAGSMLGLPVDQFTPDGDPEQLRASSMDWARSLGMEISPQAKDGFTLSAGQARYDANGNQVAAVAAEPPKQTPTDDEREYERAAKDPAFRAYLDSRRPPPAAPAAEPLESVMGPDGKAVLVPRSQAANREPYQRPTGGLSPRDATTARNKLTMIRLARQQIAEARQTFQPLKGSFSAGPLGQYLPTQEGQAFDAKINTMRGTITGLKRVPGVGAMSDYETRLDQSMMPERGRYEATTEQQLNDLDTMLNYMEQGYGGMLEEAGQTPAMPTSAPASSGGWQIVEISR